MTCHQQSAPQSTTAAYIHPDSHCAPCGDKDVAISECEEGAGSGFHSLKPEWAISMLYGLLHTAVRRGEFESFRGTASPLGTAVKVKVLPQTHTVFHLCTYAVDFAVDKMTPACLAEEERLEKRKMKELFINLQTECTGAPLQ